jgi:hypothetical protein
MKKRRYSAQRRDRPVPEDKNSVVDSQSEGASRTGTNRAQLAVDLEASLSVA